MAYVFFLLSLYFLIILISAIVLFLYNLYSYSYHCFNVIASVIITGITMTIPTSTSITVLYC